MKNDIKVLYKYLMAIYQFPREGWYTHYKDTVELVEELKKRLQTDKTLKDKSIYEGLTPENIEDLLWNYLFVNKSNGVSSNGQSTYSQEMHNIALNDENFIEHIQKIILKPSIENYILFKKLWKQLFNQVNKVQINRFFAACTLELSSTVNEDNFKDLYKWLIKHGYLKEENIEKDWFSRNKHLISFLYEEFKEEIDNGKITDKVLGVNYKVDKYWLNIFVWNIYENLSTPFSLKKQVVKFGAPGTGKTYKAKQTAKLQFDFWKSTYGNQSHLNFDNVCDFVQFHPSFGYEDFIEGLRPILSDTGESILKLQNGIFKQLCIKAGKWEKDVYALNISKKWDDLKVADIKNKVSGEHWNIINGVDEEISLTEIIPPYFILIDEINRAELSRVFGELMYCLEYRGTDGKIKTQYAALNTKETGMLNIDGEYSFFVPHNVYIIASMNTIDRSVDSFDFALRRRFKWEEVQPNMALLRDHLKINYPKWIDLANNLESLNNEIKNELLLGKDYCIGHAYLWKLNYSNDKSLSYVRNQIWNDSLGSLLEEYLRGTGKESIILKFKTAFGVK